MVCEIVSQPVTVTTGMQYRNEMKNEMFCKLHMSLYGTVGLLSLVQSSLAVALWWISKRTFPFLSFHKTVPGLSYQILTYNFWYAILNITKVLLHLLCNWNSDLNVKFLRAKNKKYSHIMLDRTWKNALDWLNIKCAYMRYDKLCIFWFWLGMSELILKIRSFLYS
jgi:hypothetical protein